MPHAIIHLHPLPSTNLLLVIITLTFEFIFSITFWHASVTELTSVGGDKVLASGAQFLALWVMTKKQF